MSPGYNSKVITTSRMIKPSTTYYSSWKNFSVNAYNIKNKNMTNIKSKTIKTDKKPNNKSLSAASTVTCTGPDGTSTQSLTALNNKVSGNNTLRPIAIREKKEYCNDIKSVFIPSYSYPAKNMPYFQANSQNFLYNELTNKCSGVNELNSNNINFLVNKIEKSIPDFSEMNDIRKFLTGNSNVNTTLTNYNNAINNISNTNASVINNYDKFNNLPLKDNNISTGNGLDNNSIINFINGINIKDAISKGNALIHIDNNGSSVTSDYANNYNLNLSNQDISNENSFNEYLRNMKKFIDPPALENTIDLQLKNDNIHPNLDNDMLDDLINWTADNNNSLLSVYSNNEVLDSSANASCEPKHLSSVIDVLESI
jgi:hypothetical protein